MALAVALAVRDASLCVEQAQPLCWRSSPIVNVPCIPFRGNIDSEVAFRCRQPSRDDGRAALARKLELLPIVHLSVRLKFQPELVLQAPFNDLGTEFRYEGGIGVHVHHFGIDIFVCLKRSMFVHKVVDTSKLGCI